MRLKKLEMFGFKTFAEKAVFEFEDAVTCLVGPNGSGKSNVVDAFKWVLGEQSARSLRGKEMVDVIFHGSATRRASGWTEVSMSIEDDTATLSSDYEEVCIRRRLYRTGESEYYLNGEQCRLKDIRALLRDTGMGVKCYGVIEQGQVDMLLRASPTERRSIFEEAAGINRFLDQRREAERKLERVQANLARVGDIIEEVQRQVRSIKYQAGRARTFERHSQRAKKLSLALGVRTCHQLQNDKEQQRTRLQELQKRKQQSSDDVEQMRRAHADAREKEESLGREVSDARQRLTRLEARSYSLHREIEINTERITEWQARTQGLQQRQDQLAAELETVSGDHESAKVRLRETGLTLQTKEQLFKARQEEAAAIEAEWQQIRDTIEERKKAVFDMLEQESQLRSQKAVLDGQKEALGNRLKRQQQHEAKLAEKLQEIGARHSESEATFARVRAELEAVNARMAQTSERLNAATTELETTGAEQARLGAESSGRRGRREVLEDLEKRSEGIGTGARELMAAARTGAVQGMIGLLADLVSVEQEHSRAVEAALAERMQVAVFSSAEQARAALRFLSDAKKARAEVLAVDSLRADTSGEIPLPPEPVEGLVDGPSRTARLSELVQSATEVAPVLRHFLGNSVLVRDIDTAFSLAGDARWDGLKFVTPRGDCVEAGGVWAAGRLEKAGPISRRSELVALDREIQSLQQHMSDLHAKRQECGRRLGVLKTALTGLKQTKEAHVSKEGDVRNQLQILSSRLGEVEEEIQLSRDEQTSIRSDIEGAERRVLHLADQQQRQAKQRAEIEASIRSLQEEVSQGGERKRRISEELQTLGSERARIQEEQRGLNSLIERLGSDIERRRGELELCRREAGATAARCDEARAVVSEAQHTKASLDKEKAELDSAILLKVSEHQALEQEIDRFNAQVTELAEAREQVEEELGQWRIRENETRLKIENLIERTRDEYSVNLEALMLEPDCWRQNPPFTDCDIEEFAQLEPIAGAQPAAESVAQWFADAQSQGAGDQDDKAPAAEDRRRSVTLEQAAGFRLEVTEIVEDPATDWNAARDEIADLKKKLGRMGGVNLDAIRQQDELEIRAQFLTDQKEDLDKARRHEREIIRELNRKSRERFKETFESVRTNFQEIFRKLFNGGKADLILDPEAEDVLDAGIEIIARPAGKETRCLSLLSGGEKALTAVALLFSVFQAKPSPFCILDEVDSRLDDSNIERFVMLLREFSERTQFIVITHNKLTMGIADALYGISSEEPGVSKKVSVSFRRLTHQLDESPADKGAPQHAKAG